VESAIRLCLCSPARLRFDHDEVCREADCDPKEDIDMVDTATPTNAPPKPDPRLREFERFIGTWDMKGRTFESDHDNVTAQATFEYLPGGFFVAQRFKADFDGMPIESLEIIGYDPDSDTFPSTVYANMAAKPLAYLWELEGDDVTIKTEELGATFRGRWSGTSFSGGWRPNPGREGPGNVPYDVSGHRATSD
jgi:hypothetical protein